SLISTYVIILSMFMAPLAVTFFTSTFRTGGAEFAQVASVISPFAATFALPLNIEREGMAVAPSMGNLAIFFGYVGWSALYNSALVLMMMRLFEVRWRVAD